MLYFSCLVLEIDPKHLFFPISHKEEKHTLKGWENKYTSHQLSTLTTTHELTPEDFCQKMIKKITFDGTTYSAQNNSYDSLWKKLTLYRPYIDGNNSTSIPSRGSSSAIKFHFGIAYDWWDDDSSYKNIKFTRVDDIIFDLIVLETKVNNYQWEIKDRESFKNKDAETERLVFNDKKNWCLQILIFHGVIVKSVKEHIKDFFRRYYKQLIYFVLSLLFLALIVSVIDWVRHTKAWKIIKIIFFVFLLVSFLVWLLN
jgi:hypothetical protein